MNDTTNKLTKLGARRLLRLAKILDTADAEHRKRKEPAYSQETLGHAEHPESTIEMCGTPACALGHYAATMRGKRGWGWHKKYGMFWPGYTALDRGIWVSTNQPGPLEAAANEFGLSADDSRDLFETWGCNNARTAKQAARYIRAFVKRKGVE